MKKWSFFHHEIAFLLIFGNICQKWILRLTASNFENVMYLFLWRSVAWAKDKKAVANLWAYTKISFMLNCSLKMLLLCFQYFYFPKSAWLLWKTTFSQDVFLKIKFYIFTNLCATLDSKFNVLWIFFEILTNICFLFLVFVNLRYIE